MSSLVHDAWSSLEDVDCDAASGEVVIPLVHGVKTGERFGWQSFVMGNQPVGSLLIKKVRALEVDDSPQVGDYEVSHLAVVDDHVVQLYATIPLRIDFHVDGVEVEFIPAY